MASDQEGVARVLAEILAERERQDAEWGGPPHDDDHSLGDWTRFLLRHLGRAEQAVEDHDRWTYRQQMIRVAALAVAAIEAWDRAAQRDAHERTRQRMHEARMMGGPNAQ